MFIPFSNQFIYNSFATICIALS
uniref:Uncharacterized protein n=1 Tax=Arundo donax TaxID=35708 RepID=A0A0A8Y6J4_ARUDO